jgi:hypothetical protein
VLPPADCVAVTPIVMKIDLGDIFYGIYIDSISERSEKHLIGAAIISIGIGVLDTVDIAHLFNADVLRI